MERREPRDLPFCRTKGRPDVCGAFPSGWGALSECYRTDICRPSLGAISRAFATMEVSVAQAETPLSEAKLSKGKV